MRFRFAIRDLLWMVMVLALGLSWWFDHRELAPQVSLFHRMLPPFQDQQRSVQHLADLYQAQTKYISDLQQEYMALKSCAGSRGRDYPDIPLGGSVRDIVESRVLRFSRRRPA